MYFDFIFGFRYCNVLFLFKFFFVFVIWGLIMCVLGYFEILIIMRFIIVNEIIGYLIK